MKLISKNKSLLLDRSHVMGILNVTPDSFSDGGQFTHLDAALKQAEKMVNAGVSFIDIGGESTRPGAPEVSLQEELDRVLPIIEAVHQRFDTWISIDTSKAVVMEEAVKAGADLINDVRALQEPNALEVAAKANVPVCLMHMQGQPRTMQTNPSYQDLFTDISSFLSERIDACQSVGIAKDKLILDPGFGFGKTLAHNYQLLAELERFHQFGLPLLAGMSRKSMVFKLLDVEPKMAVSGSLACATIAAMKGAQIIRVHDFEQTMDIVKVCQATLEQSPH
ncbi:dihydropteroate synthase [Aliivibrio fischeri]|uniref:dihydropteroate synthase n=1 Tax=Aliivibrio fischeri TaxID=668 RepID=UPI0007C42C39|nr:dihydropteroate synthase [Aliivibrio fischeri]MCE7537087.1 dihydropteroate synthase [Aliivibrio fischeri]MCE7556258.1 dihydropteroate synthase [Aliivibrio fischeri]MCE7559787.1 dihydropteroate synthase [Aliivibrio fischeri]MCE7563937.1 dihydropteroate synthase [Aliivibrio fischeri]MCE7571193.1 dihydropteroate synthase [Aliivibrio fischeri]